MGYDGYEATKDYGFSNALMMVVFGCKNHIKTCLASSGIADREHGTAMTFHSACTLKLSVCVCVSAVKVKVFPVRPCGRSPS